MKWTEVINGKKVLRFLDSSVEHNPLPRTERGKRRRASKHPNGIRKNELGYNPNSDPDGAPKTDEPKSA